MTIKRDKTKILIPATQDAVDKFEAKWNCKLDWKSGYILKHNPNIEFSYKLTEDKEYLYERKNLMLLLEDEIGLSFELDSTENKENK